ncbi:MAG: serine/threonine-protein phosphatase [Lachnospiraceae bacterium]|nr:serine/threonine-protein phosphatase [Lachnospiraceae bacterium]
MRRKYIRFPLGRKIAVMIVSVVMVVSLFIFTITYALYNRRADSYYRDHLLDIAHIMSGFFQPDMISEWAESKTPDESYNELYQLISGIGKQFEIEALSVISADQDTYRYIMDFDFTGGETAAALGDSADGSLLDYMEENPEYEQQEPFVFHADEWLGVVYPIPDDDGTVPAYVIVSLSYREEMEYLRSAATQIIFAVLIMGLLLALIPVIVTVRKVAYPIRALASGARQLVEKKKESETTETSIFSNMKISSNDEVGVLYTSLTQMESDINTYTRDLVSMTAENERIRTEMDLASSIQESQLPNVFPPFPERSEFEIYASMKPAKSVGGDFYDFFMVDQDHIALVMADVSGKGTPAALFMMIARMLIKNNAEDGAGPAEVLAQVNRQLIKDNDAQMFVTVWIGILDLQTGDGLASNAGHEYPAVRRSGGRYEFVRDTHSLPVAAFDGLEFSEYPFHLNEGDSIFVYTDGVTEARKPDHGAFFGEKRLLDTLNREPDAGPQKLIENVMADLSAFIDGAEQYDDITMLSLLYKGPLQSDPLQHN